MLTIPRKKVAVVPIFDSEETRGGIIKPSSFHYKREKVVYDINDFVSGKKLDETETIDEARRLVDRYKSKGIKAGYNVRKTYLEDQPLAAGERCDQGIVKYVGADVNEVRIGDYVFFSGYTGTLVNIEGEGRLIILPEKFIEVVFDLDKDRHEIPGLYFKDRNGMFFNATYEKAMEIIAESFTLLNKTIEINSSKPRIEDYNVEEV